MVAFHFVGSKKVRMGKRRLEAEFVILVAHMQRTGMPKTALLAGAQRALWDFHCREKTTDFVISCGRRTCLVVAEELPRGLLIEVELAGHDCMVGERGAFPQALLVELGTCALEADVPGGSCFAGEGHGFAIDHTVLLTPAAMRFADVDL